MDQETIAPGTRLDFRPVAPGDEDLLRAIYASTRPRKWR